MKAEKWQARHDAQANKMKADSCKQYIPELIKKIENEQITKEELLEVLKHIESILS